MDEDENDIAERPKLAPSHCASCGVPLPYGGGRILTRWCALCDNCYAFPREYWLRIHRKGKQ